MCEVRCRNVLGTTGKPPIWNAGARAPNDASGDSANSMCKDSIVKRGAADPAGCLGILSDRKAPPMSFEIISIHSESHETGWPRRGIALDYGRQVNTSWRV